MKHRLLGSLVALAALFACLGAAAGSRRSSSANKPVHVGTYTKRSGTRVRSHRRSLPGTANRSSRRKRSTSPRLSAGQKHFYAHHPRNKAAEEAFERQTGYPHERPGYVVDHIKPLACGGADDPSNMQWQTIADAKAKDKWERTGCKK